MHAPPSLPRGYFSRSAIDSTCYLADWGSTRCQCTDIMLMPFKWGVSATYTGLDRPGPVGGTHTKDGCARSPWLGKTWSVSLPTIRRFPGSGRHSTN